MTATMRCMNPPTLLGDATTAPSGQASTSPQPEPVSAWQKWDHQLFARLGGGHTAQPVVLRLACVWARWSWLPLLTLMTAATLPDRPGGWTLLGTCLLAVCAVQWCTKQLARRWQAPRPFMQGLSPNHLGHSQRAGFPSTHATVMAAVVGFLAPHLPLDSAVFICLGLTVLSTGWARIYAGAHFPLDVLAGFLLGGVSGLALSAALTTA